MLLLTCPNRDGSSFRLTANKTHTVGRITGDIILSEDQSVSRKHAVIKVTSVSENSDSYQVTVTDLGSKYGTYVNESTKLEPKEPYTWKDGDVIKFGCQWNEWRLDTKPLVVTTSSLPTEMKLSVKNLISELGGTVVNEWQENCSHLTMATILLTAKPNDRLGILPSNSEIEPLVVCALASAVPIVTPEYWTSFKEALEQKKLPPDPVNFVPPLKEMILNKNRVSFAVNEERKKVFADKTFVFPTEKQMKKFRALISAAGGSSAVFAGCNWEEEDFCDPDIIVMQNLSDDAQYTQSGGKYNDVLSLLKSKGKRPIPESELGLAILMCSLDMYCNPEYNISSVLLGGSEISISQLKTQEVLAADTPSMIGDVSVKLERALEEIPVKKETVVDGETSFQELESTGKIFEMETQPFTGGNDTSQLKMDNVETENKSEKTPSRKRTAENNSENPSAKKPLLEPLDELLSESQIPGFNFTVISETKSSRKTSVTSQSREDLNDHNKRKHVKSDEVFPNDQPKKSRLEGNVSKNHAIPGCSKDSDNNCGIQEKQSMTILAGSSKTFERIFSKEVNSKDRRRKTSDVNSKLREKSGSSVFDDPVDKPSTSKAFSLDDMFHKKEKQGKWNRGMSSGIFDMIVKMDELVVERPSPVTIPVAPTHKVNFKKFRKVRPSTFKDSLPEIIGESDLFCA